MLPRDPVTPATTNLVAVLGDFPRGSTTEAVFVSSWTEFTSLYGPLSASSSLAAYAVSQLFLNGGTGAWIVRLSAPGAGTATGRLAPPHAPECAMAITASSEGEFDGGSFLTAVVAELDDGARLTQIAPQVFNVMCIPDLAVQTLDVQTEAFRTAHDFCAARQAFLLLDPPPPERIGLAGIPTVDAVGSSENGLGDLMAWADVLSPDHVAAAT